MANETQNKEFNRAIKQLQAMVREKQIISLAEKFYNLKVEMSSLTRSVKEKESALILEQTKALTAKPEVKVELLFFDVPEEIVLALQDASTIVVKVKINIFFFILICNCII